MNARTYFSPWYWARSYFAIRPWTYEIVNYEYEHPIYGETRTHVRRREIQPVFVAGHTQFLFSVVARRLAFEAVNVGHVDLDTVNSFAAVKTQFRFIGTLRTHVFYARSLPRWVRSLSGSFYPIDFSSFIASSREVQ